MSTTETTPEAPTEDKKPIRVVRLETQNVMGVRVVDYTPGPESVIIVGGDNGAGKTSTIDSIWFALGGKPSALMPIRAGETEARIRLDLGDLVATRRFRYDANGKVVSDLDVRPKRRAGDLGDPSPYRRPQEVLDKLISKVAFDPGQFVRLRDAEQIEVVRRALRLDVTDLDAQEQELMQSRRVAAETLTRLKARHEGMQRHDDAPEQEVDVSALTRELEEANAGNRRIDALKSEAQLKAAALTRVDEAISAQEDLVAGLREQLQREEEKLKAWKERRGETERAALAAQKVAEAEAYVDTTDLRARIDTAEATNRKVRQNQALAAAVAEWQEAENERVRLETEIDDVRKQRRLRTAEAVAGASLAVDGLEIRDGSLWLDGIPFAQCNTEKQLRLSVALAVKENPRLRVFRIADGEKITPHNMELLRKIAEDAGAQIWVETAVTPEDVTKGFREVSVLIEDGMVLGAETLQPELVEAGA